MLQGFKDFIMKGNVIDLAVAVIVGGAFDGIADIGRSRTNVRDQ